MRNPFKSRYYFRIIDRIADLENDKEDVKKWLDEHINGDRYWSYYQFKSARIQENIDLLRNLL